MEACVAWCSKNNVELAEDKFLDDGRSGYTGEHLGEKGQLRRFIDLVDSGAIESGSYLIVESLDRLSRQSVWDALPLFMSLIERGIRIVTLMDNKVYTREGGVQDLVLSIFVMARAHEESDTKASRARDDWQNKFANAREFKKPVGRQVAKWLELKDGRYVPIPERVDVVRKVFDLCNKGYGSITIAKMLNQENIPAFRGGTWCVSSVRELLDNRCVLGEWEPKDGKGVIENYFPAVIDPDTFALAQVGINERKRGKVTRQSHNFQVWSGIAKCGHCGASMHVLLKPKAGTKEARDAAKAKVTYIYLACSNKRKALCKAPNVRLADSEAVFKELVVKVGALSLIQTDSAEVARQVQVLEGKLVHERQLLQQHSDAAAEGLGGRAVYGLIERSERNIEQLEAEKAKLALTLAEQTVSQSDKAWLLENLPFEKRDDRQRANALLKRLNVKVFIKGGDEPLYTATRPTEVRTVVLPLPDDGEPEFVTRTVEKPFLQIIDRKDGPLTVPLADDQRQKFKEQDADGSDLARGMEWLRAKIGPKPATEPEAA